MSVLLAPSSKVQVESLFATEKQASENGLYVSLETYWQQYYEHGDVNYEWNNGRLEEKGVSQYITTQLYNWFLELLQHFLRVNQCVEAISDSTAQMKRSAEPKKPKTSFFWNAKRKNG